MSKRKVRKGFDKTQPIRVDVSNSGIGEKERVQQAFFDIGIEWLDSVLDCKKCKFLDSEYYTNVTYDGLIVDHLLRGKFELRLYLECITPKEFFDMVYEEEPQDHPHAELMMAYAEDAKTHAEPWKLWQVKDKYMDNVWLNLDGDPIWHDFLSFRRKPKTHLVHGVEVPDLRIKPEIGGTYYLANPLSREYFDTEKNYLEFSIETTLIGRGLVYEHTEAGRQAAILHAKAMLGIADK